MKYVKMLGLLAVAAAALMAFAGTASATLTDPAVGGGTTLTTEIHADNEKNVSLTGPVTITCEISTVAGHVTTNDADHVAGNITALTFDKCGSSTITVVSKGTLTATDNGTTADVFSSGATVTALLHTFFGTVHCTYATENTTIGTLTESHHDPEGPEPKISTATFDINGTIPIVESTSSGLCFEEPATWEGSYTVTSPDTLIID